MAANILGCIFAFYPINKMAAYLMMPYFAWVCYASVLTYNIWYRNKEKKE
jgi:benzodiazapine receptor